MAQPTAQKLETTNCRKIDNRNPNNFANTYIFMLIQKQRLVSLL